MCQGRLWHPDGWFRTGSRAGVVPRTAPAGAGHLGLEAGGEGGSVAQAGPTGAAGRPPPCAHSPGEARLVAPCPGDASSRSALGEKQSLRWGGTLIARGRRAGVPPPVPVPAVGHWLPPSPPEWLLALRGRSPSLGRPACPSPRPALCGTRSDPGGPAATGQGKLVRGLAVLNEGSLSGRPRGAPTAAGVGGVPSPREVLGLFCTGRVWPVEPLATGTPGRLRSDSCLHTLGCSRKSTQRAPQAPATARF